METGVLQAMMEVHLVNQGPVTSSWTPPIGTGND
jgi:D-Tyr-tRNAtyr deacylase